MSAIKNNSNGNDTPAPNREPIARIRHGNITVAIWENVGQYGPMYSAHLQRSYQDADGVWQNTTSIPSNMLLTAAKALDLADTWILRRKMQNRETAAAAAAKAAEQQASAAEPPATENIDQRAADDLAQAQAEYELARERLESVQRAAA